MFGGEGNIPDSVRDAMLLKDYGSGKPLTARRILEVSNAIEALDRKNIFSPFIDEDGNLAKMAFDNGYTQHDFGKLNMAANFLMKELNVDARTALGAVVTNGSAANRAMNAGSAYMKDARSFMLAYDTFNKIDDCKHANLKIASENASQDATVKLAEVARNISAKYEALLVFIEHSREAAKLPEESVSDLRLHLSGVSLDMRLLANEISTGKLTDRKKIYDKLFSNDEPDFFSNCVSPLIYSIEKDPKKNPAADEFVQLLRNITSDLRAAYNELRDTFRKAVEKTLPSVEDLRGKLIAAANEGGMATGTSSVLPAGILDKLDEVFHEDPLGATAKIDKFCAYLEEKGPDALGVVPGRTADLGNTLEWIDRRG